MAEVNKRKMQEGGTTIETTPVDTYMGQQVTNPLMPAQGQYTPNAQQIQPGEEVSPEAYALQGQPDIPISQATTTATQVPTATPAVTVSPALVASDTTATFHSFGEKTFAETAIIYLLFLVLGHQHQIDAPDYLNCLLLRFCHFEVLANLQMSNRILSSNSAIYYFYLLV